jgi:hypothetical protein
MSGAPMVGHINAYTSPNAVQLGVCRTHCYTPQVVQMLLIRDPVVGSSPEGDFATSGPEAQLSWR